MATRTSNLLAKAGSVDLDKALQNSTPQTSVRKTAPGQLMGLQGDFLRAQEKIRELEEQLAKGGNSDRLAELEQELAHAKDELASASATREIPVAEIYSVPGRKRMLTEDERAALKANLAQHELIHPITVLPKNDRGYECIAGHNRWEIYQELGRTHIKAVVEEVDPDKVELYAFYSNLLSPALSDYEKYLGFRKRKEETGMSQQELAKEAGVSPQAVSMLFAIGELPEEAIEVLKSNPGCLGANAADTMVDALPTAGSQRIIDAIKRLASDKKFTQKDAVAYVKQKPGNQSANTRPAPIVLKTGKSKFGQIEARKGVVALKLSNVELTDQWAEKIAAFVKSELAKETN